MSGRASTWLLLAIVAVCAAAGGAYWYSHRGAPDTKPGKDTRITVSEKHSAEIPRAAFTNITREAGIDFVHQNGADREKLLPETMGGGCAFLDYNNDGFQDLLLINSTYWPGHERPGKPAPTMKLYENDGQGHFRDVTAEVGLDKSFYGMGVAVGDYDNDGWVDVFITAVGTNHLFHNEQGKFVEVTDAAGVAGVPGQWSSSCAWIDYDNDGLLDLFVCNYVQWSAEKDIKQHFTLDGTNRAYGPPLAFDGSFLYLYHNEGDGTFKDVSAAAGIQVKNKDTGAPMAKSLGVAPIDLDGDGWIDLVVANDTVQNFVFHNLRNGKFEEIGNRAGIAFDPNGNSRGAMGIDAAYFRNNETVGLAIGNFSNEMTSMYVAQGNPLQFADVAIATGVGPPSKLALKFGVFFFDYDLDSRLDLLTANGHLEEEINKIQPNQHYEQSPHLFWNCGRKQKPEFLLVPQDKIGADFGKPMVGRGATFADIDGDGDLDVLITATGQAPRLLRNDQKTGHHWLRFKLVGTRSNRDAIGAWIEVKLGGETLRRQVMPTRSYMSQSELPVTIGLGDATKVDKVTIRWPRGGTQEVAEVKLDQLQTIEEAPSRGDESQASR